jgi:acyl-coenzyme A thioesterase PaaI-like protein
MSKRNLVLNLWKMFSNKPGGKWLFSKAIAEKAPYFKTIRPKFEELSESRCVVTSKLRRAVSNHIGTFHAIAMCNMAEVTGGVLTEACVPAKTHRWIPKGMTVEYLKKAETDLRAVAEFDPLPSFGAAMDLPVTVNVFDTNEQLVFRAVITMWVSPKK